jgi:hypothetical protein
MACSLYSKIDGEPTKKSEQIDLATNRQLLFGTTVVANLTSPLSALSIPAVKYTLPSLLTLAA